MVIHKFNEIHFAIQLIVFKNILLGCDSGRTRKQQLTVLTQNSINSDSCSMWWKGAGSAAHSSEWGVRGDPGRDLRKTGKVTWRDGTQEETIDPHLPGAYK